MDYLDVNGPSGTEDNMGGTAQFVYYAPIRDFATIQEPSANPASLDELVEITTAHVMKTGKKFQKLYLTMDTGEVDDEPTGERDARGIKSVLKGKTPGQTSALLGLMSQAKNDRFIVIVPLSDGTKRQIGSNQFYAEILGKIGTGKNGSGYRGIEWTIEAFGARPIIYNANVPLTPAV